MRAVKMHIDYMFAAFALALCQAPVPILVRELLYYSTLLHYCSMLLVQCSFVLVESHPFDSLSNVLPEETNHAA